MKTININYIYAFLVAILVASCSDDFIDVPAQDTNSGDYFNTEEEYQKALVAAYDMLQSTPRLYQLGEIASDNSLCGGQDAQDTETFQRIDDMNHDPVNASANLSEIWQWMFTGVNRANYILEFQDKLDFSGKASLLAQARFLRAYYYFQLVKWFGDVPLAVDKRLQFGDQFAVDRTPKAEVYVQIEQDLIFAKDNLPYTQSQVGRITKGAAEGLLGKVYLFQNKFSEAATVLESLINNGPHRLLSSAEAPFMWEYENENNIESVFEIQHSDIDGGSFECFHCLEGNYAAGFNGVRDYNGPQFDVGYSFNVPVDEVVDAFEDGDIRLDYSILSIHEWATQTGASFSIGYEHTGYFNRKYMARLGDLNIPDAQLTNPNNTKAIRYADVLLMAAEALNRGGISDARALDYLNQVRNRATLGSLNVSGSNLTEAIYRERRVELVGEGHRFFDLVRTGRAKEEIENNNGIDLIRNIDGEVVGTHADRTFEVGKNEVFPIPFQEIQLAGDRWCQNPGYAGACNN